MADLDLNEQFLVRKVLLIIGIHGCCRKCELVYMLRKHLKKVDDMYLIKIWRRKQKQGIREQQFMIVEPVHVALLDRYLCLYDAHPELGPDSRLWHKIGTTGLMTKQVIGKNVIGKTPNLIATALNLECPKEYTGHCFRRTGATFISNAGLSVMQLKESGGWASSSIAESYVAESDCNKRSIAEAFSSGSNPSEASSSNPSEASRKRLRPTDVMESASSTSYNFAFNQSGAENCSITFVLPRQLPSQLPTAEEPTQLPRVEDVKKDLQ
jgi:hypothetical protein